MESHKLSLDTRLTILDKNLQPISSMELPQEVETPDDYIDFLVKEANGTIVQKESIPFRSFTKNHMVFLDWALSNQTIAGVLTNTAGGGGSGGGGVINTYCNAAFKANAPVAESLYGIQIGTSSGGMNSTNFKLPGLVVHGTGVGQLSYSAQTQDALASSGSLRRLSMRRTFANGASAATVTVTECGLVYHQVITNVLYHLGARDVIQFDGTAINVPVSASQTLEVVYNFYIDINQGLLDNWLLLYGGNLMQNTSTQVVPITGVLTPISLSSNSAITFYNALYGIGVYPTGICVGTDDVQPVSASNFKLSSIISHGSSSNEIVYGATSYSSYTSSVANQSMASVITRRFTNSSGGTIAIKEAGLIVAGSSGASGNVSNLLVIRKLTGTVNLLDSQTLDVAFVFNVSSSI